MQNPVCVKIHTALETTAPEEIVALIQTSHQVLIAYIQVRKNSLSESEGIYIHPW